MTDKPEDVGTGALFKNDKREKETHPHYRGDCTIHGKKFWVSAWLKEGKSGKYMSLAFRRADEKSTAETKPAAKASATADSDFPF